MPACCPKTTRRTGTLPRRRSTWSLAAEVPGTRLPTCWTLPCPSSKTGERKRPKCKATVPCAAGPSRRARWSSMWSSVCRPADQRSHDDQELQQFPRSRRSQSSQQISWKACCSWSSRRRPQSSSGASTSTTCRAEVFRRCHGCTKRQKCTPFASCGRRSHVGTALKLLSYMCLCYGSD